MAAGDYVITPTGVSAITLSLGTTSDEAGAHARLQWHSYARIDGADSLNLGQNLGALNLSGWMTAADETTLRAAMDALESVAKQGLVFAFTGRGGTLSWANAVIDGPPLWGAHLPAQPDGTVVRQVGLTIRNLGT